MSLGLEKGVVRLVPYSVDWPELYAKERDRIAGALGELVVDIEHVGSTAIPGLTAKPILDIMLGVSEIADSVRCVRPLAELGYEYKGEYGIPGRHYFRMGEPSTTAHIHLVARVTEFWTRHLHFRDYVRAHPDAAEAYARVKRDLARLHPSDRPAYTEGKTSFILGILDRS